MTADVGFPEKAGGVVDQDQNTKQYQDMTAVLLLLGWIRCFRLFSLNTIMALSQEITRLSIFLLGCLC